jgi:hypothetical protein
VISSLEVSPTSFASSNIRTFPVAKFCLSYCRRTSPSVWTCPRAPALPSDHRKTLHSPTRFARRGPHRFERRCAASGCTPPTRKARGAPKTIRHCAWLRACQFQFQNQTVSLVVTRIRRPQMQAPDTFYFFPRASRTLPTLRPQCSGKDTRPAPDCAYGRCPAPRQACLRRQPVRTAACALAACARDSRHTAVSALSSW